MSRILRYSHLKKNNADFLFFAAPWSKQSISSFNSKVSIFAVRFQKRRLNNRFFNTKSLYLNKLVQYFFARYNDDYFRTTFINKDVLFNNIIDLLILNYGNKKFDKINLNKLARALFYINIFMNKSDFYKLNYILFVGYIINTLSKRCTLNLFKPYSIRPENSESFSSLRRKELKTELIGSFEVFDSIK